MSTTVPRGDDSRMTLVEHLTELRSRLAISTDWPVRARACARARAIRRSPDGAGWSGGFNGA